VSSYLALLGPALLFYITAIRIGKVPLCSIPAPGSFHSIYNLITAFYFSSAEEKIYWVEVAMTTVSSHEMPVCSID